MAKYTFSELENGYTVSFQDHFLVHRLLRSIHSTVLVLYCLERLLISPIAT